MKINSKNLDIKIKLNIVYFFEDIAHENFIRAFVRRIMAENNIEIREDILTSGRGEYKSKFVEYLRACKKREMFKYDIVILVHDANCKGIAEFKNRIQRDLDKYNYGFPVVFAIPDPYIERWYLLDKEAFVRAVQGDKYPPDLSYQCSKKHRTFYKEKLREAIRLNDIEPIQGGAEYGERIAWNIDYKQLAQRDRSFNLFISSLEEAKRFFKEERKEKQWNTRQ